MLGIDHPAQRRGDGLPLTEGEPLVSKLVGQLDVRGLRKRHGRASLQVGEPRKVDPERGVSTTIQQFVVGM
jgi:hypothetical protein